MNYDVLTTKLDLKLSQYVVFHPFNKFVLKHLVLSVNMFLEWYPLEAKTAPKN